MSGIGKIRKVTDNTYLNFYELEAVHRDGSTSPYYMVSRIRDEKKIKAVSRRNDPDGVVMYGVYGPEKDRVVLIRQYRYPIGDYVYEFPAGLVEPGEGLIQAGIREMYEETGLSLVPVETSYSKPFFTTVGMTDESCGMVFGYCYGDPNSLHQEASEDIRVVIADRTECRRILREENVAIMCAYMLMHFVTSDGDPLNFLEPDRQQKHRIHGELI